MDMASSYQIINMDERNNTRELVSAGKLQEMVDLILAYGIIPRLLPLKAACFYSGLAEKKILGHVARGDI